MFEVLSTLPTTVLSTMSTRYVNISSEYEKNKELKEDDVKVIREWMKKQPHLPDISDLKIAFFLHSCYYKIEATKTCIETFYTIKARCPEVFSCRQYKDIRPAFDVTLQYVLPGETKEGYRAMIVRLIDASPDKYIYINHIKAVDTVINLHFMTQGSSVGQVMIVDLHGASISHLLKINPLIMKKYVFYLQEALHIRIKGIHLVGGTTLIDKLLSMVKPFLKSEIFDLIHLHRNYESLYSCFPKDMLPNEYGGQSGTFDDMKAKSLGLIEEYGDFFTLDEKQVADESKRLEKSTNVDNLFGTEGSFKKLSID